MTKAVQLLLMKFFVVLQFIYEQMFTSNGAANFPKFRFLCRALKLDERGCHHQETNSVTL